MDLIIIVAIVVLLSAIVLGSLRRGMQSVISFLVLAGIAAFIVFRLSGTDPSASSTGLGQIGGNTSNREAPMTAIKAFNAFTQQAESYINGLAGSSSENGQTGIGPTGPGPNSGTGTGTTPNNDTPSGSGTGSSGSQSNGTGDQPSSGGSVRAWW